MRWHGNWEVADIPCRSASAGAGQIEDEADSAAQIKGARPRYQMLAVEGHDDVKRTRVGQDSKRKNNRTETKNARVY